jgi:hypothetical protein
MAEFSWPEGVPTDFLVGSGLSLTGDNIVRQKMDGGPDKLRRRYSLTPGIQTCQLALTDVQLLTLFAFVELIGGIGTFGMPALCADIPYTWRFMELPKEVLACGGATVNLDDYDHQPADAAQRKHTVTFTLERVA